MLDRLPPDIIDEILFFAVEPVQWAYLTRIGDEGRRETLRSLSLVCKPIKRPQVLLFSEPILGNDEQGAAFLAACGKNDTKEFVEGVRVVHLHEEVPWSTCKAVLRVASQVKKICLTSMDDKVDLADLAVLPNLEGLCVQSTKFNLPSSLPVFSSLVELNFNLSDLPDTSPTSLLSVKTLPSLRALGLHSMPGFPVLPLPLLAQLEVLQVTVMEPLPLTSYHDKVPVLYTMSGVFDVFYRFLPNLSPQHLRITLTPDTVNNDIYSNDLTGLLTYLETSTTFRTLLLPFVLHPSRNKAAADVKAQVAEVIEVCQKRDIHLLWHDESDNWGVSISRTFWRHAQRVGEEKA